MKKTIIILFLIFVNVLGISAYYGFFLHPEIKLDSSTPCEINSTIYKSVVEYDKITDKFSQAIDSLVHSMVFVKGGSYMKGFIDSESIHSTQMTEEGVHSFYISKYEVTQRLWELIMGNNPSIDKNPDKPVDNISWEDCQVFLSKLNAYSDGRIFRFPTDTEWEYAARGGDDNHGFLYAGSNFIDMVGWYKDNSNDTLHYVGEKWPNELGLYDMTGNVREWAINADGEYTTCGGDYMTEKSNMLVAYRNNKNGSQATLGTGLRLVVESLAIPSEHRFVVDYFSTQSPADTLSFVLFARNNQDDQYSILHPNEDVSEYSSDFDISHIKEISIVNPNKNTVLLQLPECSNVILNEVTLMGDGKEIDLDDETEVSTDANNLTLLNKDGKIIYNSYVSVDTVGRSRKVELNAVETAVSLLLPIFPYSLEVTSDELFTALKNLLKELSETQNLAEAIDRSVVRHGYFEIDDVEVEFQTTVEKIIELTGLRNNFLSEEYIECKKSKAPRPPKFNYGYNQRMKIQVDKSLWTTSYFPAPHNIWRCELTVKNGDVLCYSSIMKGSYYYNESDDETRIEVDDDKIEDLIKYIVKPIRSSTLEDAWLTWDGISNFFDETWKLLTDDEYGIGDVAPVAEVKKGIKMDFELPNDCVCALMPCDNQFLMMYNIFKLIMTPIVKYIGGKVAKDQDSDILIPFAVELLSDPDYLTKFHLINEKELDLATKFVEILELTWPKLKTFIKKKLTSKDAKFFYAYFMSAALQSDNLLNVTEAISDAMDKVEDNLGFYLKLARTAADTAAGIVGIYKEESNFFFFDLDFNNSKAVEKEVFNAMVLISSW